MAMKDFIVHLNVSKHRRSRLEIAARLAKAFDAHLTGLYTSAASDVPFLAINEMTSHLESSMRTWWTQLRDQAKAEFEEFRRSSHPTADWCEIGDDVGAQVSYRARYADLTIVGQIDPAEVLPRPEYDIPERVALASGRPVLIIPYAGTFETIGKRVLIAWDGSPQAARAVNDALPFLSQAEKVTILTINPDRLRDERDQPGARIAAYLSRHQITADARDLVVNDISVDDMILSQAADESIDLIVMGAYGHLRAGEIIFGGTTRGMFKHMTVPTLMSH
jgi:nucleotide-binding universal stress UspA family protein